MSDNGDAEAPASPEVQVEVEEQPEAPDSTQEQAEPQQQDSPQPTEEPEAESKPEAEAKEPESSPPEEQPAAAAEPEAEKPEEGEKTEDKPAEDEKTEEETKPESEPEVEEKPVEEEPIVITPEGNPHWLSTEDVLAKDLPESEVENFRNFYFKHAYSLQAHYDSVKDVCVETEYITLSKEEIDALTVEGELSEEQQQCLNGLRDRVNAVMELWEGDGALIKINDKSAKDAYLERTDEAFVETIRDGVINSLEFEKQSICAYSVWKDQEHHPGVFKRGMTKLRASFRRTRTNSSSGRRRPKLEEEKKDDENQKKEEGKEDEKKPEGEEAKPAAEGEEPAPKDETPAAEGEGAAATEVTVEAEVETADKPEETAPKEEEAPKEEAEAAAAEPPKDEEPKDEAPKEAEPEVAEAPKPEEDKKEDGEIQAAPAEEGEAKKEEGKEEAKDDEEVKSKPSKAPKKKKSEESHHHHHHQHKAAKNEPLDNRVLRAFRRVMGAQYEVKNGQAAVDQLRNSAEIRRDLNKLKAFGGVEGVQVSMSICRWKSQISDHTGMIFRGFVYENELRALSQYDDTTYYPNVFHYKEMVISGKIQNFFMESVKEALKDLNNYIVDFFVAPDKIYVLRLNPFYTAIGACLFTWNDGRILTQGPFEFRVVDTPKMAPEAYTSYKSCWQDMLNSVLQQRKAAARPARSGATCVIL